MPARLPAQATAPTSSAEVPSGSVPDRLARLRSSARTDAGGARDAAWGWIGELGTALRTDRAGALADLGELFARGGVPRDLDGPTQGSLVGWAARPLPNRVLSTLTDLRLPWVGKRFDAASSTGDNLMTGPVRYVGKVAWPLYSFTDVEGKTAGFRFTTFVEEGKQDPDTDVLVIDYDSVPANPRLGIRSVRDELVEVVPGAYLGKMLFRAGRGDGARYALLAYFALKSPIGSEK